MTNDNDLFASVQRNQLIESLVEKATEALKEHSRLAPHELRAYMGFPEPTPSQHTQQLIREVMSLVVRDKKAKWAPAAMSWLYLG